MSTEALLKVLEQAEQPKAFLIEGVRVVLYYLDRCNLVAIRWAECPDCCCSIKKIKFLVAQKNSPEQVVALGLIGEDEEGLFLRLTVGRCLVEVRQIKKLQGFGFEIRYYDQVV